MISRCLTCLILAAVAASSAARAEGPPGGESVLAVYTDGVQPILSQYCYGCHGSGAKKGGVSLDAFADAEAAVNAPKVWHAVLKNVREELLTNQPNPG